MSWGTKQLTLTTTRFERYAKTTRPATFLAEMPVGPSFPQLAAVGYGRQDDLHRTLTIKTAKFLEVSNLVRAPKLIVSTS
jgi:hypothetical protein